MLFLSYNNIARFIYRITWHFLHFRDKGGVNTPHMLFVYIYRTQNRAQLFFLHPREKLNFPNKKLNSAKNFSKIQLTCTFSSNQPQFLPKISISTLFFQKNHQNIEFFEL